MVREPIRVPSLTPDEALQLHHEALVIDAQQPPATSGFLFNDTMRAALADMYAAGYTLPEAHQQLLRIAANEIQTSSAAANEYMDVWNESGITVGAGTYAAGNRAEIAFEETVTQMAQARSIIDASDGRLALIRNASDIERVYQQGTH